MPSINPGLWHQELVLKDTLLSNSTLHKWSIPTFFSPEDAFEASFQAKYDKIFVKARFLEKNFLYIHICNGKETIG